MSILVNSKQKKDEVTFQPQASIKESLGASGEVLHGCWAFGLEHKLEIIKKPV